MSKTINTLNLLEIQARVSETDEQIIRADERANLLTQFLFELGKNVAYEKEKVFGTDVIRIDALMTICHEIEEQLKPTK